MFDKVFIIGSSQDGGEAKKQKYASVQWYEDERPQENLNKSTQLFQDVLCSRRHCRTRNNLIQVRQEKSDQ